LRSPRAPGKPQLLTLLDRVCRALLAVWALTALELLAVGLVAHREFASIWELENGAFLLAPSAFAFTSGFGLLGAGLAALLWIGDRPAQRIALTALFGLFGAAVGWGVGGGRHLAALEQRAGFSGLVALVVGGAVYAAAPHFAKLVRRAPLTAALVTAAAILVLELGNRWILPRLYSAFHDALGASALLLAPSVERALFEGVPPDKRWRWVRAIATPLLLVAAWFLIRPFGDRLSRFDNFRFLLSEKAPILGRVVELTAELSPPPPIEEGNLACGNATAACGDGEKVGEGASRLDLRGRDLLLVSIDALRADHVTSYGYARPTTPNLDRLGAEGVVFERAYTATPHTSYAVTSLMTGKYLRPLLLQGTAADSDTWAGLFRTYGYRTAAFYPPAVFFIDPARFESFSKTHLGFEYAKVEFAEGEPRLSQVREYIDAASKDKPLFVWVHLFGPHEPYERHPEFDFGTRDVDRYDSEIAEADRTLGELVKAMRQRNPESVVIATADHGEEFEEHGGRYHGTTVYEEQVRVPLVISAPGAIAPNRVTDAVQTIDLLPTLLSSLDVPRPPRLRGRDLSARIASRKAGPGFAHAETDEQTLLAEGKYRLICARRVGACRLYDLEADAGQTKDAAPDSPEDFQRLRDSLREIAASHGRYESQGLRAEGKGWPPALVRGIAGDADAVEEVADLLNDVDPVIRRKAAQVLFDLKPVSVAPSLRLALSRDEDPEVRRYAALSLTRLGEGAPLAVELLRDPDQNLRRLAALSLGESGDKRAEAELIAWWRDREHLEFTRAVEVLGALAAIRSRDAIPFLLKSLDDVRLRPYVAKTLSAIGDESGRYWLARALANERSHSTRAVLLDALLSLGAREELAAPLVRLLGVPDPPPNGIEAALRAKVLQHVGGPEPRDLARLRDRSDLGVRLRVFIPKGGNGTGVRVLVRAHCAKGDGEGAGSGSAEVLLSSASHLVRYDNRGELVRQRGIPELDAQRVLRLPFPCTGESLERFARVPDNVGARPGVLSEFVVFANRPITIEGVALVPLADELPPPPPEPWIDEEGAKRPG
jgi:arylsulfatase A-like enzyme